jgi:hypothetical protein
MLSDVPLREGLHIRRDLYFRQRSPACIRRSIVAEVFLIWTDPAGEGGLAARASPYSLPASNYGGFSPVLTKTLNLGLTPNC